VPGTLCQESLGELNREVTRYRISIQELLTIKNINIIVILIKNGCGKKLHHFFLNINKHAFTKGKDIRVREINSTKIAKLAGVSRITVSRVINNYPNVPESTREKVMKVIKENNYYPNLFGQVLISK
jgi:hypothetical protein